MQEVLNIHETAGLLNRGMVYRTFPEVTTRMRTGS